MDAGAYKSQKRAKKRDATDVSHSNSSWDERMMVESCQIIRAISNRCSIRVF